MDALNPSDPPRPESDANSDAKPGENKPMNVVFASMSGMGASEHDTHPPGATPESLDAGYEPDRFNVRTILYVPLLVAVIVVVGFATITTLFVTIVRKAVPTANTDPQAEAISTLPINERFARISSTDPKAAVPQPRLEYIKQVENGPGDPTHYRSKRPIEYAGATYEIRPEDLRPGNFIDPTRLRKILIETGHIDRDRKIASIPIADAMAMLIDGHKLPTRKGGQNELDKGMLANTTPSDLRAKISNSGRGGPSMPVAVKPVEKPVADKPAGH